MTPPLAALIDLFELPFQRKVFRQTGWALAVGLLAATAFGQTVTANFASRSGGGYYIPSRMFGINLVGLRDQTTVSQISQAGITESNTWGNISGVYATSQPDWSQFDWQMKLAKSAGLHPLVTLAETPSWLQPSPNPCVAMGSPAPEAPPTNVSEWAKIAASYVAHLDAAFPGLVQAYQIWNEPELQKSFCVSDNLDATRLSTYLTLYAEAASAMRAQAARDGVTIEIGGPVISDLPLAKEWIPALLSDSSTYPNVDFISYHIYVTGSYEAGMDWNTLYADTQSPTMGEAFYYLEQLGYVSKGLQPKPSATPIYITEYNDNWLFAEDCCRNHPAYGPLWNSVAVVDFLNTVYGGAKHMPNKFFYFAGSATPYFCIAGQWNATMNCDSSELEFYPQFYSYQLLASPAYLGLSQGGHMALSVSAANTRSGLLATAFYNSTQDTIVVVNPTNTSYSSVTVVANNAGFSSAVGTLFILDQANPHIARQSLVLAGSSTGEFAATIAVPAYSTVAVTIAAK